jgi:uncharacterized protein YbaR (Trm112 family)
MVDPEFLAILRCPIDPGRTAALTQPDESHLLCSRCEVRFPVRDGFPILLSDEAQLPAGCSVVDGLPCRRG